MVALPNFAVFTVSRRSQRNDAVVGSFGPHHDPVRELPFRTQPISFMAAGDREVANAGHVRHFLVESPAAGYGQVIERLKRHSQPFANRLEEPAEATE